jgi:hypothetical protein
VRQPLPQAALTVAELVQLGPLAGVRLFGDRGRDADIRDVLIVDTLEGLDRLRPHSAVVLAGAVARDGWTVEMALRKGWEHAAACVVVPHLSGRTVSAGALADRLGVPLLLIEGDALEAAVRIASAVAEPSAGRTALLAEAAARIADAGVRADRVLAALNAVLPATIVALTDPAGRHLAGRGAADPGAAPAPDSGRSERIRLEVSGPDGRMLGALDAVTRSRVPGWPDTVLSVLRLALAPLTAWAASRRLADERSGARSTALLERLLAGVGQPPDRELLAEAAALGWPTQGPLAVFVLRPATDAEQPADAGAVLRAAWPRPESGSPLIGWRDAWVGWHTVTWMPTTEGPNDEADEPTAPQDPLRPAVARARRGLSAVAAYLPAAAGVSGPVAALEELGPALADAAAAASVAAAAGPGTVVRADRMGPVQLLSALPGEALLRPAQVVLAPLLAADREGALLATLAAVLDAGASPSAAAERLGVHRNTVAARMDRIRALGFDPDDPQQRLALHLACRLLLDAKD